MNITVFPAPEHGDKAASTMRILEWDSRHSVEKQQLYLYNSYQLAIHLLIVLFSLPGLVGNGIIIWFLGFCVKKNSFSIYILNLACAHFTFLLASCIEIVFYLFYRHVSVFHPLKYSIKLPSYLVGLALLSALSTECCVLVFCPIWYRCHWPANLSAILCALIWGLASVSVMLWYFCLSSGETSCLVLEHAFCAVSVLTFLVLCVSGLTLLIRLQCCPSRLSLTVQLNLLFFLVLGLPYGVNLMVYRFLPSYHHGLILFLFVHLLLILNSMANPVIYFLVGRHRQPGRQKPLEEMLQRALSDEKEGV